MAFLIEWHGNFRWLIPLKDRGFGAAFVAVSEVIIAVVHCSLNGNDGSSCQGGVASYKYEVAPSPSTIDRQGEPERTVHCPDELLMDGKMWYNKVKSVSRRSLSNRL